MKVKFDGWNFICCHWSNFIWLIILVYFSGAVEHRLSKCLTNKNAALSKVERTYRVPISNLLWPDIFSHFWFKTITKMWINVWPLQIWNWYVVTSFNFNWALQAKFRTEAFGKQFYYCGYSRIVLPQLHPNWKFYDFFVSTISYRPTDLSLLKEFSKNGNFWKFYIFLKILPNRGHWLAILLLWL